MQTLLTVQEVADALRMDADFVLSLIQNAKLRAYRLGDARRISEADLEKYLETCLDTLVKPSSGTGEHRQGLPENSPRSVEEAQLDVSASRRAVPTYAERTTVIVSGSVADGAAIWMGKATYPLKFSKDFFRDLLAKFRGQTIRVGISFGGAEPGSLGKWIQENLGTRMNPTYAVAGLLIAEGYAQRPKRGYIHFFEQRRG